ncbi:hypothetical protein K435DRAFT_795888 [Dendrothele bispora CBS 962.96]|uniref:Uncharacterized protein n=1 Tax=Dendrothele bispora (strain CBS 962.96) TaxID=1314807 RepID=A0A4S8M7E0_DENBC|nr:hypothetical protein K435DRAFT_795888 [Dendrothele bispora CBS 962.96]
MPLSLSDLESVKEWIFQTAIAFLLYGIYILLSIVAINLLIISSFGIDPPDTRPMLKTMKIILLFVDQLNFLISDIIVVWRAWIMFSHSSTARFALIASIIGTTAGVIVDTGMTIKEIIENIEYLIISYAVISQLGEEHVFALSIYFAVMPQISAIYPVLVIIVVALENAKDSTTLNDNSLSQSIKFTSIPVMESETQTLSSLESQSAIQSIAPASTTAYGSQEDKH